MILSELVGGVGKALFGDKGLAGGTVDLLKSVGVIKDPEAATKALGALQAHEEKLGDQEIKLEEIAAGDRDSARDMQVSALSQSDRFAKLFVYWYAIGITITSFIYFFAVTFIPIPTADQKTMANIILGFLLGTGLATIIAFFYGTTKKNLEQQKAIAKASLRED